MAKSPKSLRTDHFVRTSMGRKFYFSDMARNEFDPHEIGHHLSQINRFTGATKRPYTVAAHCVAVARKMMSAHSNSAIAGMIGLLHDAPEAYIGDVNTPLKRQMRDLGFDFNAMVAKPIENWMYDLHGVGENAYPHMHARLHVVDLNLGSAEGVALVKNYTHADNITETLSFSGNNVAPEYAARMWVDFYLSLKRLLPRGAA